MSKLKNVFEAGYLVALVVFIAVGCGENQQNDKKTETTLEEKSSDKMVRDVHSFSNFQEVASNHIHLDLTVDFDKKQLKGYARHSIDNIKNSDSIVFDTKNLTILNVFLDDRRPTQFSLREEDELLGKALVVKIEGNTKSVTIEYETGAETEALQWLDPVQTAGGKHPYLFTQGQAILTRSWVPCQDSPGLRITYSANVQVPEHLMAVMSASNPTERTSNGRYEFEMKQPIPSYLIALAVGDLEFQEIDHRTGVYAEPQMLESCAYELAEMGKMVELAEALYGPYQWERYDVIVLPPSFPFGGMENPRLTFATPTIIAGDRSLTALIAHELAHSWSGNLVTNATWDDFWLNEGFTVYFERRIMEDLYDKDYVDMLAVLGRQDLTKSLEALDPKDTFLKLRLKGRNPDDGMTDIAYEKGYFFLRMLEENIGREKFDAFLLAYFDEHKFKTLTTETFLNYLNENLADVGIDQLNVNEWIYAAGIPDNCPEVKSVNFENVEQALAGFYDQSLTEAMKTSNWSTHEWLHMIRNLRKNTTQEQMNQLDQKFKLTEVGNCEIAAAWFEKAIEHGYLTPSVEENLEKFLVKVGRRKFLMPLYTVLKSTNNVELARGIYSKARSNYHFVSIRSVDELLDVRLIE